MRPALPAFCALLLSACAAPAFAAQDDTVLHYLRTNADGSEPEAVSVWLRSDGPIEVFKRIEPCTRAALVTASFDPATGEAGAITGGRLGRDGAQEPFAWLTLDASRTLTVRLGAPDAEPLQQLTLGDTTPWRLYDFDFADWNAAADGPPADLIRFELALVWPDADPPLSSLGHAEARWMANESRLGRPARRYQVSAGGFEGGDLWLDAETGTVIEVRWGQPNHAEYRDLHLVLTGRESGQAAWRALLARHWAGCAG